MHTGIVVDTYLNSPKLRMVVLDRPCLAKVANQPAKRVQVFKWSQWRPLLLGTREESCTESTCVNSWLSTENKYSDLF